MSKSEEITLTKQEVIDFLKILRGVCNKFQNKLLEVDNTKKNKQLGGCYDKEN